MSKSTHRLVSRAGLELREPRRAQQAFNEAVLHRLPGAIKCQSMTLFLAPGEHVIADEFGAVIGHDIPGLSRRSTIAVNSRATPSVRDGSIRNCAQTFLGDVVRDVEDAEAPAVSELVVEEVQ